MSKNKFSITVLAALGLGLMVAVSIPSNSNANATADYYRCNAKVGGEYNYGRAPMACDASAFGDDRLVLSQFSPLIFLDASARTSERERYAQEMNSVIREVATYYLKNRKAAASSAEINGWVTAVQLTASHESYWSHYRKATDGKIKMMRGDSGHGHGLMQIDDRAHFPAVTNGIAWNFISHMIYAMDILYPFWVKAPTTSCVGSESNYEARTRAAWASYNSGESSQLCRWTNSASKWAENDKNFYQHVKGRFFDKYVADKNKASSLNIPCLMEKRENCPGRGPASPPDLQAGVLYQTADGRSCVINNAHAFCVAEVRDAICLNSVTGFTGKTASSVQDTALARYAPVTVDRHKLCAAYEPSLIGVGRSLETKKTVNFRTTPGGGILGSIPAGQTLEVFDFELRNAPANERYYKIHYQNQVGFIFGGTTADADTWAVAAQDSPTATLAKVGDSVRVLNAAGVNLRATAGGAFIMNLPVKTEVQVLAVQVQGSENGVYYKVRYAGNTGFIYSGLLLPINTTAEWTLVLRATGR